MFRSAGLLLFMAVVSATLIHMKTFAAAGMFGTGTILFHKIKNFWFFD
jgi:hypothetical protein